MTHRLLLFIFFLLFSLTVTAQNKRFEKDILKIESLLKSQTIAWNNGDIDGFMAGYWNSDSLVFIGKKGLTYGFTSTLDNYKKSYPTSKEMGYLTFTIHKIKVASKKHAFVIGQWHLKREIGDVGGYFTLFLEKINKQWYVIADHSS